jgi:uncharacterized membrane protein YhhN
MPSNFMQHRSESRFPPVTFLVLFASIVFAELASEWTGNILLHRTTKPLIMLSLLVFAMLQMHGKLHQAKLFLFSGMFLGMVGDGLLMFKSEVSWAIEGGLGAFLLGHIFYMIAYRKGSKGAWKLSPFWIAALLLTGTITLYFVLPHIGTMLVPLVVYALVLFTMAIIAKERQERVTVKSYRLVWFGALCFVASDTALAFDLFVRSSQYLRVFLMVLYAVAQYRICVGMLEQMRSETV